MWFGVNVLYFSASLVFFLSQFLSEFISNLLFLSFIYLFWISFKVIVKKNIFTLFHFWNVVDFFIALLINVILRTEGEK